MDVVLVVVSILLFVLSLVPSWDAGYWWIRAWDFPRIHMISLAVLTLIGWYFVEPSSGFQYFVIGGLILALCLDLYRVIKYLPLYGTESAKAERMKNKKYFSIMSANVLKTNRDYQSLIENVFESNPEVLLLIEPDNKWQKAMAPLRNKYPYYLEVPQENTYGMFLYSKYEISDHKIKHLVDEKVPSIFAKLNLNGEEIQLICLHPRPPRPQEGHSHERDAELMKVARLHASTTLPTLVIGDLNDVAWSHTTRLFLRASGLLDPRIGRGFFNTFPAEAPWLGFPLDHVFHSKEFLVDQFKKMSSIGSDHLPMYASFILDPKRAPLKNKSRKPKNLDDAKELENREVLWSGPNQPINSN